MPTATSVTADVIAACRNLLLGVNGKRLHAPQHARKVKNDSEMFARYFHRIHVRDEIGVLTKLSAVYSDNGASLATLYNIQKKNRRGAVFTTHRMSANNI